MSNYYNKHELKHCQCKISQWSSYVIYKIKNVLYMNIKLIINIKKNEYQKHI